MKKTIVMCVVIVLLVAALGYVVNEYVLTDSSVRAAKQRIKTYRILEEEQRSMLRILQYKIEIAKIQSAFVPKDPNNP